MYVANAQPREFAMMIDNEKVVLWPSPANEGICRAVMIPVCEKTLLRRRGPLGKLA